MSLPRMTLSTFNHITRTHAHPLYLIRGHGQMAMTWHWLAIDTRDPRDPKGYTAPFDIPIPDLAPAHPRKQPHRHGRWCHKSASWLRVRYQPHPTIVPVEDADLGAEDSDAHRVHHWNYMRRGVNYFATHYTDAVYLGLFRTSGVFSIGATMPIDDEGTFCTAIMFHDARRTEAPKGASPQWTGDADAHTPGISPDTHPWVVFFYGIDDASYYRRYKTQADAQADVLAMDGVMPEDGMMFQN